MTNRDNESICGSSFWDPSISWDTKDPDLTLCMEKTVLVWAPCLLLLILSPLEINFILRSKCRDVPWGFLNITKLIVNILLICLSGASLGWAVVAYFTSGDVYVVDILSPAVTTISFILALVLLSGNKIKGLQTSGVLFMFWLCLSVAGIPQYRTEIRHQAQGVLEDSTFNFTVYMIHYPSVVLMFVLNIFADKPPRVRDCPQSETICPEVNSSFASRILFQWFTQLVWKGSRKPLEQDDMWDLKYQNTSSHVVPMFEKQWSKQSPPTNEQSGFPKSQQTIMKKPRSKSRKPRSIVWPVFRAFWRTVVAGVIYRLLGDLLGFVNPQLLGLLINFVAGKEFMWRGFLYASIMFVTSELQTIFYHQSAIKVLEFGIKTKTSVISTIFRKALHISNSARKESTVGQMVNLMAVDAQRFVDIVMVTNMIYSTPFTIALSIYFLWKVLGPSGLAGLVVMVILVPINIAIANKVKTLQMKQMKYKDQRLKLINEVLSGIKVLKLYALEPRFEEHILKIRAKEMAVLRKAAVLNASISFIWNCSSFVIAFASLGMYVLVDEHHVLTAEIAFVAAALFNVLKQPVALFPVALQTLIQINVSTKRINNFLNSEELDLQSVSHDENKDEPLIIEGGSFSWGTEEVDEAILRDVTLRVKAGSLTAVVGAVGSGKSSLISAFLGEMDKISGYVNTEGRISYVPQQAWIQNASVKDNIVFGNSFDRKRYVKTVEACALEADFAMLPNKDQTEIGEKGINLSGGQKQRVSLARAVYHDADTYLLDDPLSAVDSHVGKHIFENVIGPTGVLKEKTRVLVSHAVTFLPKVDVIVVLKEGQISEMGTFKELLDKKEEFAEFWGQHISESEQDPELEQLIDNNLEIRTRVRSRHCSSSSQTSLRRDSVQSREDSTGDESEQIHDIDRLIQKEKSETGAVKWSVYFTYFKSIGLYLTSGIVGCQIAYQVLGILANVWIGTWTQDKSAAVDGVQDIAKRNYYLEMYAAFVLGQLLSTWTGAVCLAFGSILASRWLHLSMLTRILRAPMSFFDTTPSGRIINRFGTDIDILDNTLPGNLSSAMNCFCLVGGTLIVITMSTPLFAVVILPIGALYYLIQRFYVTTSRQLKRLESVSRSPICSHFSETISGLSSIRAYLVEDRFIKTSEDRVDLNQNFWYLNTVANRWLGIRLETVGNLLIFFAALFAVLGRDSLDAGLVGLSISYALQITSTLNIAVRSVSFIETNIVSVERIIEYSDVFQEAVWKVVPDPPALWPTEGKVEFKAYQVRYRAGLDLVLQGISFTVAGGEKIGIVGRTGAGKSSLTLCLFRILESAGGSIYIDGVDISKIGLGDLRSKLTIIPQDPVLFSASLRMNLDPFESYSDKDIWKALELAHLKNYAKSLVAGLNHMVTEGGDNLSVGQRQLICLARALLRKSKVLILDEATAAIDLETDVFIQQTIRKEFQDCTVLTIAHRLNTIMDSDRILVLDQGKIKEFDSPSNLLGEQDSAFYSMAKDAGLIS